MPLAFEHVGKTSIGIHCGFVPQLHAAQLRMRILNKCSFGFQVF